MSKRILASLSAAALLSACGIDTPTIEDPPTPISTPEVKSDQQRITQPNVPPADAQQLSLDNADFAFDFYRAARQTKTGNLVFSPHSLQTALAMTYAGARGNTALELKTALRFTLPEPRLHAAFNATDLALASRGVGQTGVDGQPFRLRSVNATWGQGGYTFLPAYLDTLALNYGAGLRVQDFAAQPDASRDTINAWVAQQTEDRIPQLLPQGSVTSDTRMVLTNAVYFNASWKAPFHAANTVAGDFQKLDGTTTTAQFMKRTEGGRYGQGQDFTFATLPYAGDELDFVILLPDAGKFAAVEAALSAQLIETAYASSTNSDLALTFPKFKLADELPARAALSLLGVNDLFSSGAADLSGIDGTKGLFVSDVLHKVFMDVNEKGTEAAAATGVVIGTTSIPVTQPVVVDRPFIFAIRDRGTKALVFVGSIVEPKL